MFYFQETRGCIRLDNTCKAPPCFSATNEKGQKNPINLLEPQVFKQPANKGQQDQNQERIMGSAVRSPVQKKAYLWNSNLSLSVCLPVRKLGKILAF